MPTLHGGNFWSFGNGSSAGRRTSWFDVTFLISGHADDSEEIEQHGVGYVSNIPLEIITTEKYTSDLSSCPVFQPHN